MILRDEIEAVIKTGLTKMGETPDLPLKVEYAREEKFGDYACTVAMDKRWREAYIEANPEFKNPRKFAEALVAALEENNKEQGTFEKIEIAGPGFINLTLSPRTLYGKLRETLLAPDDYGNSQVDNPRKINFEFISANPTGPLNVVSARAAALGDSVCNLLEAVGEDVYREFYVNDYGNQVDLLGVSVLMRFFEAQGIPLKFASAGEKDEPPVYLEESGLPFPAGGYHGEYLRDIVDGALEKDPTLEPSEELLKTTRELAGGDAVDPEFYKDEQWAGPAARWGRAAIEYNLDGQRRDLDTFRVSFNNFYMESSLHENGDVPAVKNDLGDKVYEKDGKTFFRSSDYADDKDRVIIRDDGRPTYLMADIAYHKAKTKRGFTHLYNIWGPDHHGYIARLAGAMQAMGWPKENFNVLIAQQVNLLEDGKPYKMSKRLGNFVTMEELNEQVPVDVSRYFFVMRSFEAHLDYDLKDARDVSDKNPYYYVAYAHARIRSIFRKASDLRFEPLTSEDLTHAPDVELSEERRRMLWLTARFPEEVRDAALSMEPHRLVTYLYSLATAVSKFYNKKENKIIDQDAPTAATLLVILEGVAACLKNGLKLLGMRAPDRMDREEEEVEDEEAVEA